MGSTEEPVLRLDTFQLPDGLIKAKLSPAALAIASELLEKIKTSGVIITQFEQLITAEKPLKEVNGIVKTKSSTLAELYELVNKASPAAKACRSFYMHNKSLFEVVGKELTERFYNAVQPLSQDVLVKYPLLYISDNPKSSNDVLIGGAGSWTPLHMDLPLYCTSVILVLEGHKEFAVVQDDVVPSLHTSITYSCWEKPTKHDGVLYSNLPDLVHATGGAVVSLRAGDMLIMPPRMYHFARNLAATVSCNFSVCTMDSVPTALAQTLNWMHEHPANEMRFDEDLSRLLADCTETILQQEDLRDKVSPETGRERLPPVQAVLDRSLRLMEWYQILRCIPKGWVQGFWGELRTQLLDKMWMAVTMHSHAGLKGDKGATAAKRRPAKATEPASRDGVKKQKHK